MRRCIRLPQPLAPPARPGFPLRADNESKPPRRHIPFCRWGLVFLGCVAEALPIFHTTEPSLPGGDIEQIPFGTYCFKVPFWLGGILNLCSIRRNARRDLRWRSIVPVVDSTQLGDCIANGRLYSSTKPNLQCSDNPEVSTTSGDPRRTKFVRRWRNWMSRTTRLSPANAIPYATTRGRPTFKIF